MKIGLIVYLITIKKDFSILTNKLRALDFAYHGKWAIVRKRNGLRDNYYVKAINRLLEDEHVVEEFDTAKEADDQLDKYLGTFKKAIGFSKLTEKLKAMNFANSQLCHELCVYDPIMIENADESDTIENGYWTYIGNSGATGKGLQLTRQGADYVLRNCTVKPLSYPDEFRDEFKAYRLIPLSRFKIVTNVLAATKEDDGIAVKIPFKVKIDDCIETKSMDDSTYDNYNFETGTWFKLPKDQYLNELLNSFKDFFARHNCTVEEISTGLYRVVNNGD